MTSSDDEPEKAGLRETLILGYRPVVEHIARRYSRGYRESTADLIQAGMVGLVKAVDNVQLDRLTGDVLGYLIELTVQQSELLTPADESTRQTASRATQRWAPADGPSCEPHRPRW